MLLVTQELYSWHLPLVTGCLFARQGVPRRPCCIPFKAIDEVLEVLHLHSSNRLLQPDWRSLKEDQTGSLRGVLKTGSITPSCW